MRLLTCLFKAFLLALFLFSAFCIGGYSADEVTKAKKSLFCEDFESYAPGAKEIKTFASSRNAEVVEESFYPGGDHQGERSLRLSEYNRPDKPDTRGWSYFESKPFPAAGKIMVSFWVKTKEANVKISLLPNDTKEGEDKEIIIFQGGVTVSESKLDDGWQFVKKEVALSPEVSKLKFVFRIVSRGSPTGFAIGNIDEIKVEGM
jgi:hypothetical protein